MSVHGIQFLVVVVFLFANLSLASDDIRFSWFGGFMILLDLVILIGLIIHTAFTL